MNLRTCCFNRIYPFFIDCAPFKFGEFCNNSCSESCRENRCNKTTGHCLTCSGSKYGSFCEYDKEVYQQPTSILDITVLTVLDLSIFNFFHKSKLLYLVYHLLL